MTRAQYKAAMRPRAVSVERFGLSQVVPYLKDEYPENRHARRYRAAQLALESVMTWCEYRGVELLFVGDGTWKSEVWKFRLPDGYAVWHPAHGWLRLQRPFRGGTPYRMKCYDAEQLLLALTEWAEPGGPR